MFRSNNFPINRNYDTNTSLNIGKGYQKSESQVCALYLEIVAKVVFLPCAHLSR